MFIFSVLVLTLQSKAGEPTWIENEILPSMGRSNPYEFTPEEFIQYKRAGQLHAQIYPVTVTGILVPYKPFKKLLGNEFNDRLKKVGMVDYPLESDTGIYSVPYPNGVRPDHPIGFGLQERKEGVGFTISCAECHAGRLFGKTVLGMTNRFPKANATFVMSKFALQFTSPALFQFMTGATDGEAELLRMSQKSIKAVGPKDPLVVGLDTSLAQVALSLARRNADDYATQSDRYELFPRKDRLADHPADSKPAVWWNTKYKNRWLSDGSVVSGNPIYTNILWNEVGRGSDLKALEKWLSENDKTIREITTAVFSSEAPKYTDFFSESDIDLASAQKGERLFNETCSRCHGTYEKDWNQKNYPTVNVKYKNKVYDVGTDSLRYEGMKSLEKLNDLTISKKNHILIRAQKGYISPPLVGIWARWPYFHNNSVASLCEVLTRSDLRQKVYYAMEANDKNLDFDQICNGYPMSEALPEVKKIKDYEYDTNREGMSASGHDEGIFLENGQEILSIQDKMDLIMYLKTL